MNTININLVHPWTINNGRITCPVTLMVEGVHNGNHGPILWPARI